MMESLKCPGCSAPLERPVGAVQSLQCPYCHSSVLLDPAIAEQRQEYRDVPRVFVAPRRPSRAIWFVLGIAAVLIGFPLAMNLLMFVVHQHVRNTTFTPTIPPASFAPTLPTLPSMVTPETPAFAKQIMKFGSKGVGAGQFDDVRSIAVDGAGHIYVGEAFGGRVQVFDAAGKFLKLWSVDPKHLLVNLVASREGTVWAVSAGIIQRYEGLTGKSLGELKTLNADDQRVYFNDICIGLSGDLFALDQDSNIWILNGAAEVQRTLHAKQMTQDDEIALDRIAVSGDGRIYAIDHHRGIFQFTTDGKFVNRFAMTDDVNPVDRRRDVLRMAVNIAVDGQGRVIVADLNPALKIFDRAGRFLGSIADNEICFGVVVNDADDIIGCFRNDYEVRKYRIVQK